MIGIFSFLVPLIGLTAILVVMVLCGASENKKVKETEALEKGNKDFIQLFAENFWNNHNIAAFEKYFSADIIIHSASGDQNGEQYKNVCQAFFNAFPDLHLTTNDIIAEGDKVAKVWTPNSTHNGEFTGIPPTGKRIGVKGMEVFRSADGKIAEVWASMDNLGMIQQPCNAPPSIIQNYSGDLLYSQ